MNFKEWLLLTEAKKSSDIAKELLGNDESLFKQIKSIIPTNIPEKLQSQLLPIAAFYHKQQQNLNTLKQDIQDYSDFVKNQKMQIITVKDNLTIDGDFKSYIHWTEIIHGKKHEDKVLNAPTQGDVSDQEIIEHSPDLKIKVYKANSVNQCIVLGKGESFCISQPANTMFQSYRDGKISTFYFVYDNTRTDDLAIVVVDATKDGIELTDRKNETAQTMQDPYETTSKRIKSNPSLYFKYLQEKGIDITVFKNIKKSTEEEAEHKKLGEGNASLIWFKSLSPEEKSRYIGRGHPLSNEQFNYIYDNNFILLLKQYVKTGLKINDYQIKKIVAKKELKENYLHNRLIADQNANNLSKQEYDLLNPKQKEEFYNFGSDDTKIKKSIRLGNLDMVKHFVEKSGILNDTDVEYAARYGHLDVVKYLVEKNANIGKFAVAWAAEFGSLDIVKYLLGDEVNDKEGNIIKLPKSKNPADTKYGIRNAGQNGYFDIVKYLFEKGADIDDRAVRNAIEKGNLHIVNYLIEKGAKVEVDDEFSLAAQNGHLDILKYLLGDEVRDKQNNIYKLPKSIKIAEIKQGGKYDVLRAAEKGHLDVVKYLIDEKGANIENVYGVLEGAFSKENFDLVKYLVEKYPEKQEHAACLAASHNQLDMLKYIIEKFENIDVDNTILCAVNSNIDIIKYLVEEKNASIKDYLIDYSKKPEIKEYLMKKKAIRLKADQFRTF
jgi:ankyrin repeat protein